MHAGGPRMDPELARVRGIPITASLAFGYIVGIALMLLLFDRAIPWLLLATTRLLDLLMRAGIVARADGDAGLIFGLPSHQHYLMATDPVDWALVIGAIGIYMLVHGLHAARLHLIARTTGIVTTIGHSFRGYIYGTGLSHLLPLNVGQVAIADAYVADGATAEQATQTIFINRIFVLFEIFFFAIVALILLGWATWVPMLYWPVIYLITAYLLVRPVATNRFTSIGSALVNTFRSAWAVLNVLIRQPIVLAGLILMSILAFFLVDVTVYILSQAYTGTYVLLNIEPTILLMGIVGARLARFVQITPGGIGQGEWGFCMALVMAGQGFLAAAAIAMIWGMVRYISILILMLGVVFGKGVNTNLRRVISVFQGVDLRPATPAPGTGTQPAGSVGDD
jgi:hypothetical protein